MRPGIVLGLHLAIKTVLVLIDFIFEELLVFFQLVVEDDIVFELVFVVREQRMLHDVGKGHSLLAVHHEYSLEEIFKIRHLFFESVFLGESGSQAEGRVAAAAGDFGFHVVALVRKQVPLKGYSANSMK